MNWLDHSLLEATITASRESQCLVIYGDKKLDVDLGEDEMFSFKP